jgi:hypothetical protein
MIKQTKEESKQETVAPIGISSELADSLEACANKLTAERKATKPPTGYLPMMAATKSRSNCP